MPILGLCLCLGFSISSLFIFSTSAVFVSRSSIFSAVSAIYASGFICFFYNICYAYTWSLFTRAILRFVCFFCCVYYICAWDFSAKPVSGFFLLYLCLSSFTFSTTFVVPGSEVCSLFFLLCLLYLYLGHPPSLLRFLYLYLDLIFCICAWVCPFLWLRLLYLYFSLLIFLCLPCKSQSRVFTSST